MRTTPPYSWESLTLCLDGCFTNRFKGIPCFWTAKGRGEFFPNSFKLNRVHRYLYIFYTFHIHFIHFHTFHIFFWSDNTEINNPTSNSRSPFEIVSSKKAAEEAEKEKDDWRQFLPQSAWNIVSKFLFLCQISADDFAHSEKLPYKHKLQLQPPKIGDDQRIFPS